jgi:nucleotide-binding universal stress UspA family protein
MKTLLICTDFSKGATNAAEYGCKLAREYQFGYITLFHGYQTTIPVTGTPVIAYDPADTAKTSLAQLKELQQRLQTIAGPDIMIRIRTEELTLWERINEICREESADMIVMGRIGKTAFEKILFGSHATSVSQNSEFPVLIIPENSPFVPLRKILLACDLNKIVQSTPLETLDEVLQTLKAPLIVLNVNEGGGRRLSTLKPEELHQLHALFDKYKTGYAFVGHEDTVEGILGYAKKHEVSLIITIPRNYNFFQKILHKSTTKKLIYESDIPVLSLHE